MGLLEVNDISKNFGAVQVLKGVSFALDRGEFGCLLGSSGSGKSTLLRIIAGLEVQDKGQVKTNGKIISGEGHFVKPEKRNIGMIFQDYALFPHLTVEQNILFGTSGKKSSSFDKLVQVLGLAALLKRYPHQVSGGQQQRVSIARSLMVDPQLLLMDEPFSNLDEWMKEEVRDELKIILRDLGATVLFVTHHAQDALSFADRIMIMDGGKIIQQGNAQHIINQPVNAKVAGIFGKVNRITHTELSTLFAMEFQPGNYFIRPEDFVEVSNGTDFTVDECIYQGNHYDLNVSRAQTRLHIHFSRPFAKGEIIKLRPVKDKIHHEPH